MSNTEQISLTLWSKIKDYHKIGYTEALILPLTNGKPYFCHENKTYDCTHDLAVYAHELKKVNFNGEVLEVDASLILGEYREKRRNIFGCSFNNGLYLKGFDFRDKRLLSLNEARNEIPKYLGISLQEFLRLFQLPGMTETCRQGIREILQ